MRKNILFVLALISSYALNAQIDIGSSADELLYFLEFRYKETKKKDPFGVKGIGFEYEIKRERGVITDVMVYQKNQIFIDLQAKSNTVTDYEILDNEITGILTSYESLTVEHIEERFDKIYGDYKVDGFYFTDDFKYVRNIFWHEYVTAIHYTEALPSYLGNETYAAIREKQLENESENDSREYNKLERKRLLFDYVNIDDYVDNYSDLVIPKLEEAIVRFAKKNLEYNKWLKSKETPYNLNAKYEIRVFADKNQKRARYEMNRVLSNLDYYPYFIRDINFNIPQIEKEYDGIAYKLNREFRIELTFDVDIGIMEIKNSKGKNVRIISDDNYNETQKQFILENMKQYKSGRYKLSYQFGTINGKDISAIYLHAK